MKHPFVRLTLFILISFVFISCQKEVNGDIFPGSNPPPPVNPLLGTWKFTGLTAATKAEATATDGTTIEKIISTSNYSTVNNKGSFLFNAADFAGTGLSYDLSTAVKAIFYENNTAVDTIDFPFNFSVPPTNSTGRYKLAGADSVYFFDGFISIGLDSMASKPIGYKYSIAGGKLSMKTKYKNAYSEIDNGVRVDIKQEADIIISLEK